MVGSQIGPFGDRIIDVTPGNMVDYQSKVMLYSVPDKTASHDRKQSS